ncbi:MAG TPA: beta-ketoacyl-[acyl-carrier-protein] synthase family protein, partial [Gemmataceae bacterium]|nr:beta-ketoacyl-[acyl-carrier-protein] synthase family protein [Gemmataceae bacterium]
MRRRVVITGMGAITPLGHSVAELYDAQIHGRSGIDWISHFDASTFPTRFAGEVKNFDLGQFVPNADSYRYSGPNTRFALVAAQQALADAGIPTALPRERFGIYLGNGDGQSDFFNMISAIAKALLPDRSALNVPVFVEAGRATFEPQSEYELEIHTTAGRLAHEFQLPGPNFTCQTACAASSQAIGEALQLIRQDDADLMLAGGAHSMIHPFGVTGFNRLTALSTRNEAPCKASRPFDLHRDGFVLGEGSGMVVLEELEHARKRGAPIYAEVTGYGSTADAFRVTDSHDEGRGAIACMLEALRDSGLAPSAIGYINAHGTST